MRPDQIVRAFKEGEDWYIHLYTLDSNSKHNYVQVVKHVESGELRIRKVSYHRRKMGFRQSPANIHFEEDLNASKLIDQVYDPSVHNARFAQLLSESTILPEVQTEDCKYTQVSYWTFCNGVTPRGGLRSFMNNCTAQHTPLPDGLIIRFAWNLLESILFLYTMEDVKIRLQDVQDISDLTLHFRPGQSLPDLYVADFGDSYWVSRDGSASQDPNRWDIPRVMFIIVFLYLKSEAIRSNAPLQTSLIEMHQFLVARGSEPNAPKLAVLLSALDRINRQFNSGEIGFVPTGNSVYTFPEDYSLVPYLQAVTRFAENNALQEDLNAINVWKGLTGYYQWQHLVTGNGKGVLTFESL